MRAILGCLVVLALNAGLLAEDKKAEAIDAKKLVGKWEPKEKKEDIQMVIEFAKDGKMTVTIIEKGKDTKLDGTYAIEGNKLTTKVKAEDRERTRTRTVSKLTDTELVSTDETGKEDTLLRLKDK
jgi:uncharacterized protein (TIGR03066 family)